MQQLMMDENALGKKCGNIFFIPAYMVEWDDEGTFSEVKVKAFVNNPDPSVGQAVEVREGSRKKTFSGTVIMKGSC